MARTEASEISIKLSNGQLEFLKSKAKEIGITKEELAQRYIEGAIEAERGRFSLKGRFNSGRGITYEEIQKVTKEWGKLGSL